MEVCFLKSCAVEVSHQPFLGGDVHFELEPPLTLMYLFISNSEYHTLSCLMFACGCDTYKHEHFFYRRY